MSKDKFKDDLFWVSFMGEFVEILAKYETSEKMPLNIQGYMLDTDDTFYYIGDNPLEVNAAIRKTDVCFIAVVEHKDPGVQILEDMEIDQEEAN